MRSLQTYLNESLKQLGRGAEGTVYDLGDGRVKKVFHDGRVPIAYQLLRTATESGDIQVLPNVYEVGDDYIIRENCKTGTPLCRKYWKVITSRPISGEKRRLWQLVQDGTGAELSGFPERVLDWLLRLRYEMSQIKPGHGLGDLAEKNLGETEDGRIVLMDF